MPCHLIDLKFQDCEQVIAAYVVPHTQGAFLVEPGPYVCFEHLTRALANLNVSPQDITDVFVTHVHFDHAGAAWALAEAGARIHVHPLGLPHLADPTRLWSSASRIYGEHNMLALWGEMRPIAEDQLKAWDHEQQETLHSCEVTALATPGHAKHHHTWCIDQYQFWGDVGGVRIGSGPVEPPCPPPDIDLEAWFDSIDLLMNRYANQSCFITHFGQVNDPQWHLRELASALRDWSAFAKTLHVEGTPQAASLFEEFVDDRRGRSADGYQLANPASMSYPGLARYWKRSLASEA